MIGKNADKKTPKFALFALVPALLLTGCGGGDGSSAAPPVTGAPANSAPQFTSGTTASTAENTTGSIYNASATDADGDALTFTISGGADAAAFSLSGAALSFVDAPNFDRFADANSDNVYEVILQASDGRGGTESRSVNVTVSNDVEGVSVRRLVSGLDEPVAITGWIDDDFILVGEKDGTIWSIDTATGARQVWRDLNLAAGRELLDLAGYGAGSVVQTPTALIRDSTGIYMVAGLDGIPPNEFKIADGDPQGAGATLAWARSGGDLGGASQVVVAIGDPGGQRTQGSSAYGKIYVVLEPTFTTTSANFVLVGRGIQQPTDLLEFQRNMLLADAGQNVEHELSFVNSRGPLNFGWPFFEGLTELQSGAPSDAIAPRFSYPLGNGPLSGSKLRGGVAFDGSDPFQSSNVGSLQDRFVLGDESGKIFTVDLQFTPESFENRTEDFAPDMGTIDNIMGVAEDFSRVMYILDADGEVFVVEQG